MTEEEKYRSVQNLIFKACHSFQEKRGGTFEDLLSVANEAYMKASQKYNPERSKFSSWVYFFVWAHLLEDERTRLRRNENFKKFCQQYKHQKQFDVEKFILEISEDAGFVVRLIMSEKIGRRRNLTNTLLKLRWSPQRIEKCVREIKESLKEG